MSNFNNPENGFVNPKGFHIPISTTNLRERYLNQFPDACLRRSLRSGKTSEEIRKKREERKTKK